MVEFRNLEGVQLDEVLRVFNLSFSDYLVPLQLTKEQLEAKLHNENINWKYSVGAFENNTLVGFILHCDTVKNGQKWVYNGGTGVIPTARGNALTQKMYAEILPVLKENQVDYLILEVLEPNEPAIKSYLKSGYTIERTVSCYKGEIPVQENFESEYEIKEIEASKWDELKSFWDFEPTWQNSDFVLDRMNTKTILGAFKDEKLVGYVILQPQTVRLNQFAVNKDWRRKGVATALFQYIGKNFGKDFSLLNLDASSENANAFLAQMNGKVTINQYEMVCKIQ